MLSSRAATTAVRLSIRSTAGASAAWTGTELINPARANMKPVCGPRRRKREKIINCEAPQPPNGSRANPQSLRSPDRYGGVQGFRDESWELDNSSLACHDSSVREKELRLALICYGGISLAVY